MTDEETLVSRVERLEALVERQAATIETQRERIDELEAVGDDRDRSASIDRRTALKAGGLAGLLALGTGAASADPQGQVGTAADPLSTLYAEELNGGVTGGQPVTDLFGDGLEIVGGQLTAPSYLDAPADLDGILADMARDGDGTYVITNVYELQAMAADLGADYRLGSNVDARTTAVWHDGAGFAPVGSWTDPFTGTFDGESRVVRGLAIERPSGERVGLFGSADGATVQNVGLVDVGVHGRRRVGGLAGHINGTVQRASVTGAVSGESDDVGGLCGYLFVPPDGRASDSYAAAHVTGERKVGGLVGVHHQDVSRCFATGPVEGTRRVGGLVGDGFVGAVDQCYAMGSVTGLQSDGVIVGGLVGDVSGGSVTESYATGAVSGTSELGGVVGVYNAVSGYAYWDEEASGVGDGFGDSSGDVTGLDTDEMQGAEEDLDDDLVADFDFEDTWAAVTGPDDYPVLRSIDEATQLAVRP